MNIDTSFLQRYSKSLTLFTMFNLTSPDRVIRIGVILLKGSVDVCRILTLHTY